MLAGGSAGAKTRVHRQSRQEGRGLIFNPLVAENLNPESRNSEGLHAERCPVPFYRRVTSCFRTPHY